MAKDRRRQRDFSEGFIKQQVAAIDTMIVEIGEKTLEFIRESREKDVGNPSQNGDDGDVASYFQVEAVRTEIASKDARKLQLLVDARWNIMAGSYGFCVRCRENIIEKRLVAAPWANRCTPCQEAHDKGLTEVFGGSDVNPEPEEL